MWIFLDVTFEISSLQLTLGQNSAKTGLDKTEPHEEMEVDVYSVGL